MLEQGSHVVGGSRSTRRKPHVKAGDYHSLSYTTSVDGDNRTQVAPVRTECNVQNIFLDTYQAYKTTFFLKLVTTLGEYTDQLCVV